MLGIEVEYYLGLVFCRFGKRMIMKRMFSIYWSMFIIKVYWGESNRKFCFWVFFVNDCFGVFGLIKFIGGKVIRKGINLRSRMV